MEIKNSKIKEKEEIKASLVPPFLAMVFSAVIPGLGQIFARHVYRGLTLMMGFFTGLGLLIWRFAATAKRDVGFINIFKKGIRLESILLWLTIAIIILWIWIIIDAYLSARRPPLQAFGVFIVLGIVFFSLGWQIAQVDLVKLATDIGDGQRALKFVMWPWSRATTIPEEYVEKRAYIQVPCTDDPFPPSEILEDEPYLIAEPNCGMLALQDNPGSGITLTGGNFIPGEDITIVWRDPVHSTFTHRENGEYLIFPADESGNFEVNITMPFRLVPPSGDPDRSEKWSVTARQVYAYGAPVMSKELKLVIEKMIETIFIGMMATAFGIVLALPISFLAARNMMSANWFTLGVYYGIRLVLNLVRSIETIIWAIVFVIIVGLGPFAGILALTVHSIAALAKLYSESIESIDQGPIEAVHATGANWIQTVRYAVFPQIIPPFVSFTIYRWDINIRMSTIVGLVGGGGIGYLLMQWIGKTDFKAAGIAVWFIAVTVAILDFVSAEIRERFV